MKVRKIRYRSGSIAWQLDYGMVEQGDGKMRRLQKYFETKDAATGALASEKAKRQRHGDSSISLSEEKRVRFIIAEEQLAAVGATIEQAVAYYLRHSRALQQPVSLADLLSCCIALKERLGKSVRYLQQFRCSCLNFVRGREEQLAHTVTRQDVRAWVSGNNWAPKTQRVYLGDLRSLFSWAVSERLVPENPCVADGGERIELSQMPDVPISTLSATKVRRLLVCASAGSRVDRAREDFRPLLWYAVLGLFAGVRPAELERLDSSAVSLDEKHVVVQGHQAKTRRRRVIDLSENAIAWLKLDANRTGPIAPPNFRRRWERLRAAVKLLPWPHDVMRHTFASMHYAAHQNESLLKAQMGHSAREDVLFQHYRAIATRKDAARFWTLTPGQRGR